MSSGSRWWSRLELQDALDGAVLLFLEDLVAQWRVFEWHLVGLEILYAKWIVVVQERHDVLDPLPHVGLSHPKLYLHVEEVAQSSCSFVLCKMEPTSEPPASIPTASMAESTPRPSVRFSITSLTLSTAE